VRWQATIAAVAAACVVAPALHATAPGAVLDQSDRSSPDIYAVGVYSGATVPSTSYAAQTFTAGLTGLLTDVVLPVSNRYLLHGQYRPTALPAFTGPFTVRVERTDASGAPDPKSVIATSAGFSVPLGAPNDSLSHSDASVSFPSPAGIAQGHTYALVLVAPPELCWTISSQTQFKQASCSDVSIAAAGADVGLAWAGSSNDIYPAGTAWGGVSKFVFDLGFSTYVAPDTEPPSAPTRLAGSILGSTLRLSWTPATDNGTVDHYLVYLGTEQVATSTTPGATVANVPINATSVFTVQAVDTSGNVGPLSAPVTVAPAPRPTGVPSVVPPWAARLLAWQDRGGRGPRPKTPNPLPRWYAAWRIWQHNPLQIVSG
jgi:hypothetical protein